MFFGNAQVPELRYGYPPGSSPSWFPCLGTWGRGSQCSKMDLEMPESRSKNHPVCLEAREAVRMLPAWDRLHYTPGSWCPGDHPLHCPSQTELLDLDSKEE